MAPVHAKTAGRGGLRFASLGEMRRDLDGLERAHAEGALRITGDWSPGQIFAHLAQVVRYSIDGFPFAAPLSLRLIGPLVRKRSLRRPFPRGLKLRGGSRVLEPRREVTFDEGLAALRSQLDRVDGGERMSRRSPIFGRMGHEDWVALHLRHAELHLGFLHPAAE